jgi:hypothetical protein
MRTRVAINTLKSLIYKTIRLDNDLYELKLA